jgi:hypothetical protein
MITLHHPSQAEAEIEIIEHLHCALTDWPEADYHFLNRQLEGALLANITVWDFNEAADALESWRTTGSRTDANELAYWVSIILERARLGGISVRRVTELGEDVAQKVAS